MLESAGFNPGFFPASKCVKPELFPIIDHDGMAKPAVLINVEQMVAADIEEIFIVIQQVYGTHSISHLF